LSLNAGDGIRYEETALSPVRAVVETLDDSSTEALQDDHSTLGDSGVFQQIDFTRAKSVGDALTLSLECGNAGAGGFAAAGRACSEGDVLSGVDPAAAAATPGRSSRLLSCASTLFGRLLTPTRQRLATSSAVDWRRRSAGAPGRRQYGSSGSFRDVYGDRSRASRQTGDADDDETAGTPCDGQRPSVSGIVSSSTDRRPSRGGRVPAASPTAVAPPTGVTDAPATRNMVLRRARSSRGRATVIRHPSIERLDAPRRRAAAAETSTTTERKRAERFRRQYVDVLLQRRAGTPTDTNKSLPSLNECGTSTSRHHSIIASPQLLHVPATADITLA